MLAAAPTHHTYSFGEYVLDIDRGALLKGGAEVRLRRQSFEVLRYLVEHHHRLVTRDELTAAIWGNAVVTEGSLTQCLIEARRAIGDGSRQMIRTVPRRGYKFEPSIEERDVLVAAGDHLPAASRRRAGHWVLAASLLAAVAAGGWLVVGDRASESFAVTAHTADSRSIAVLPFVDMSERQDQAYLSEGIAEEILDLLARRSDLNVIGRTSSFSFKNRDADIPTIAAQLHVAWVLEGSVRRSENRIRIAVRLVDAATGMHRWADTYDREFREVLVLQDEIALEVAKALETTIPGGSIGQAARVDAEAYARLLQGRHFFNRRGPGDLDRAAGYYRRALEREPGLVPAWAGLAGVYWALVDERPLSPADWARWHAAVEQALIHGPNDADAHSRAAQYAWQSGNHERYLAYSARAEALRPDPGKQAFREMFAGSLDPAIAWQRKVVERDPLSSLARHNFAALLVGAGRTEEAYAELRQTLELNPGFRPKYDVETAFLFIEQRRLDDALATIERLPDGVERDAAQALALDALEERAGSEAALARLRARGGSEAARKVAEVYAQRGEVDAAFRWLATGRREATGRGGLINPIWLANVRLSPFLAPLHGDPRWKALMALAAQFG